MSIRWRLFFVLLQTHKINPFYITKSFAFHCYWPLQSYIESIKEESETRRHKFYKSNIAQIFNHNQGGSATVGNSVQTSSGQGDLVNLYDDRQSVKSDNTFNDMYKYPNKFKQQQQFPLIPKARDLSSNNLLLPDNVLIQEEKQK